MKASRRQDTSAVTGDDDDDDDADDDADCLQLAIRVVTAGKVKAMDFRRGVQSRGSRSCCSHQSW